MAKRYRNTREDRTPPVIPPGRFAPRSGGQGLATATLVGVVALLMISFSNWREIDNIKQSLDDRLDEVDARLGEVAQKIERPPAAAPQQARRGPDPNRVYKINTAGAPARGPAGATVTIAEFSDFQ